MNSHAEPLPYRTLALAAVLGLMHAAVDFTTVTLLLWGTRIVPASLGADTPYTPEIAVWHRFLLYNALAFGTQFPLGAIADRWKTYRGMLLAGLAVIALAVLVQPFSPQAAVVLASLGNAAFHVGAGAIVLTRSPERTLAAGIMVGPGAIGLAAGMWCGRSLAPAPWMLLGPLAVCCAVALTLRNAARVEPQPAPQPVSLTSAMAVLCAGAMILVVALRTANGNCLTLLYEGEAGVLWALAIASCAGCILGGLVADRFGWMTACMFAILLSAPLLGFQFGGAAQAVIAMLLFHMTMPVTLMAISRVLPGEAGLAFGLAALGVLLGAVPDYVCPSQWVAGRAWLLSLSVASIAAILIALPPIARLGRPRRRTSLRAADTWPGESSSG
jgi:FSR family fosmidomycin resistance protein-like MFS transporter